MKTGTALLQEVDSLTLAPGACAFWWLGQLGYILKIKGTIFYLDPFLAPSPHRNVPPLLDPTEITHADWVLGSHDHGDHIDPYAIPRIAEASPQARFVCSRVAQRKLLQLGVPQERIVALDDGITFQEGDLTITPIPAAHEFLDRDPELGYPYLGFVIEMDGVAVYHAGDTVRYEGMAPRLKRWALDVAFLPINGRDAARLARNCIGNMVYQEAVDLAGEIEPRLTVPGHYEMFSNNSENPALFADYMRIKYPHLRYWIGEHGTAVVVPPRGQPWP